MAVNLETLLPEAFQVATYPLVPSNNGAEAGSLFDSDLFSPTSMYGNENLSFLEADSNSMSFDPSIFKDPALQLGDDGVQYLECGEPLYQPSPSGIFNDSWMTTPMSLPLTPDEPLGRDTPALSTSSPIPAYNSTPIYPSHTPSPAVPLTPDSLVSPQSSCNGEELDEVLSYFSGSVQCDSFPASDLPATTAGPTPSTICNDSSSSLYSSYASLVSGPNSPLSPSSSISTTPSDYTPYTLSPCTPTPSSLTHHSIMPQDTIRDLLAQNSTHSHYTHEDAAPEVNFEALAATSERVGSNKRSIGASVSEPAVKKAKVSGAPRSRKRVSVTVKKERKREQNKTAALRYRQKKKEEKVEYESQQAELEDRNDRLKDTLKNLEAEVSYLKRFWAEVQQAKRMQGTAAPRGL